MSSHPKKKEIGFVSVIHHSRNFYCRVKLRVKYAFVTVEAKSEFTLLLCCDL
uniref:Uncharacterized protein n=1 Tax=Rhizophora mucronata TaxID=61149 RepID=A0A2P2QNY3_RHIMU